MPDQVPQSQNTQSDNIEFGKPRIKTIPKSFYGAHDPAIMYASDMQSEQDTSKNATAQNGMAQTGPTVPGTGAQSNMPATDSPTKNGVPPAQIPPKTAMSPAKAPAHKNTMLYIAVGLIGLIVIISASWYAISNWSDSNTEVVTTPPIRLPVTQTTSTQTNQPTNTVTTTTQTSTSTIATSTIPMTSTTVALNFPRLLFVNASDMDADDLTDAEEEIFGTDPGIWDSDNDGYYDGQEVFNLYNPKGFAPIRIIDSGLVSEEINQAWGYRFYYPARWQTGMVDTTTNDQLLVSSPTGEYIEVRAFKKGSKESFRDWFARNIKDQQYTDLVPIITPSKEKGYKRRDNLVAYFESGPNIYVLIYQPGISDIISYRQVMFMVMNSFRFESSVTPDNIMNDTSMVSSTDDTAVSTTTSDTFDISTTTTSENSDTNTSTIDFFDTL